MTSFAPDWPYARSRATTGGSGASGSHASRETSSAASRRAIAKRTAPRGELADLELAPPAYRIHRHMRHLRLAVLAVALGMACGPSLSDLSSPSRFPSAAPSTTPTASAAATPAGTAAVRTP